MLGEPSAASEGSNALLRAEFARLAEMPDSAIFHDDLATLLLHTLVEHH